MSDEWIERRRHYQNLSHDALVAIVVELLDERDRLIAASEITRDEIEAASVAMIHECRRMKISPGKVGSAGQWGILASVALKAAAAAPLVTPSESETRVVES